jgi:P27 family predicted phage terminase small subunit
MSGNIHHENEMKPSKKAARPPAHLSKGARKLWKMLTVEYGIIDAGGLEILATGLSAHDRFTGARLAIEEQGLTITDRFGVQKPHPLLACERDARGQWLAALKQLCLDVERLRPGPGRPGGR